MLDKKQDGSAVSELNRGGQVLMHFIRMLHQTVSRYFKIVIAVFCLTAGTITYKLSDETDWYMGLKYGYSYMFVNYLNMEDGKASLTLPSGRKVTVTDGQIVQSRTMKNHADNLIQNLFHAVLFSGGTALIVAWFLYKYLRYKGREESKDEHRRGAELASKDELIEAAKDSVIEDGRPSRISIAGIPLIRFQENSGIALVGSPGVGKSTTARDVLRQLRAQKQKAVLYDISGEFTKRFYRPGKDVILNVFDSRSHSWDFWAEGRNPAMYDRHAKAAIPDHNSGGDPFWVEAPRLLFSSLLEQLGKRSANPSVEHLMNIILRMSNEKIANVVATTDARNVMNLELDKLAGSVRAVITAYTRNFKHLAMTTGPRFSFRDWAQDEDSDAWVFITVRDDMKDTLKPMMTMMIESALSSILTLEPSQQRLIGTILDELGTLHEIPSLLDYISTCRKFGGMPVLGFQSDAQLEVVYGEKKAQVLMDSIGSLAAFRINGSKGANWLADQLGNQEVEESTENTSFGANDVRDATTMNRSSKEQDLLLKSQITKLPDNTCYLRLGRGLPVAKIKFPFDNMPELHPGIVETESMKDESFVSIFRSDNDITPETVVEQINRQMSNVKRESQQHNGTDTKKAHIGKTAEQIINEVVSDFAPDNKSVDANSSSTAQPDRTVASSTDNPNVVAPVNPVFQALNSSSKSGNPVAQALSGKNKVSPENSDDDSESDDSGFIDLSSIAMNREFDEQSGNEEFEENRSVEQGQATPSKNTEKSISQINFDGGF